MQECIAETGSCSQPLYRKSQWAYPDVSVIPLWFGSSRAELWFGGTLCLKVARFDVE
mgnify:CR=1 FL=1